MVGAFLSRFFCAIAIAGLIAACQTTSGGELPAAGEKVSGVYSSGGNQALLPPGEWTVAGSGVVRQGGIVRYELTALYRAKQNVVSQLMLVRNANPAHQPRFDPYPECESDQYVFTAFYVNEHRGRQDCWRTQSFFIGQTSDDQPHIQEFQTYAKGNGLVVPPAMIGFIYHLAEGTDAMDVAYLWNPDLVLPHPAPDQTWAAGDWTVDRVRASETKSAVFTTFRKVAAEWHPAMWQGFYNQLTSGAPTS